MEHEHHPRGASSLSFVDRAEMDRILTPLLPDDRDRGLVLRCILDEGPAHHRGVNFIFIKLLADLAGALPPIAQGVPVPMRLPPHVRESTDSVYPLRLTTTALEALARSPGDADAMTRCLLDGPPQHFLANVVMVALIEAIGRRLAGASSDTGDGHGDDRIAG